MLAKFNLTSCVAPAKSPASIRVILLPCRAKVFKFRIFFNDGILVSLWVGTNMCLHETRLSKVASLSSSVIWNMPLDPSAGPCANTDSNATKSTMSGL